MNLLASLALFLAPSIYFLIQNLGLGNDSELFSAAIISIALFGMAILLISPLLFLKKKNVFFLAVTFISAFWYFQFLIPELLPSNNFLLQLAIIASISLLMVVFTAYINTTKFVLVFLGLNLLALAIPKTDYLYTILSRGFLIHESSGPIKAISKARDVNIYYVLADGLTSPKVLNQTYKIPVDHLKKKLKTYQYSVFDDSKSSYNITYLTLASIFSLDYPVIEGSKKYKDRADFFPSMLSTPYRVPLLVKLDSLNYKFVHIGNKWGNCYKNKLVSCISDQNFSPSNSTLAKLSENYNIQTFLQKTLFARIATHLFDDNKIENENDALERITSAIKLKKIDLSRSTFYFVHHFNPHPPALKEDCSVSDDKDYQKWTALGYTESSKCALNRISEFIDVLSEADPGAIVVIQGDHGPAITYNFNKDLEKISENELEERFAIFNAIKLPEGCLSLSVTNLGNVETIQLVVDCITGSSAANKYSKSYAGFYEKHKHYGEVFEVNFKKLPTPNLKP